MATDFRIVFAGAILDGLEAETVKQAARQRLKIPENQFDRIFSGKPVVLKKGLNAEMSERYVSELTRIGMNVRCEPMDSTSPIKVPATANIHPATLTASKELSLIQETPHAAATHGSPLNATAEIRASAPARTGPAPANLPHQSGTDRQNGTGHAEFPGSSNAERTLIASPEAIAAYLAANSGADPLGHMVVTNIKQPEVLQEHMEVMRRTAPAAPVRPLAQAPTTSVSAHVVPMQPNSLSRPLTARPATENTPVQTALPKAQRQPQGFSARDDDDTGTLPVTSPASALWPKLLLTLVAFGGVSLLGLVIWMMMK